MSDQLPTDVYTQLLLDAAHHPVLKGQLSTATHQHTTTNASCGDEVTVQLQLSADQQTILAVRWQGTGCIISQAHMDALAQSLMGQSVTDVLRWEKPEIMALFGLEQVVGGREKCLLLGLKAVKAALIEKNN